MENLWLKVQEWVALYGIKVIVALVIFIVGRWIAPWLGFPPTKMSYSPIEHARQLSITDTHAIAWQPFVRGFCTPQNRAQ